MSADNNQPPDKVTNLWGHSATRNSPNGQAILTAGRIKAVLQIIEGNYIIVDVAGTPVLLRRRPGNLVERANVETLQAEAVQMFMAVGDPLLSRKVQDIVQTAIYLAPKARAMPPSFTLGPETAFARAEGITLESPAAPTPTWDGFIARCGANGEALMAYTWAILSGTWVPQYVYLYGGGGTGKSSYIRFLERLMGSEAHVSISAANQYWPASCVGKRVVSFSELNNTHLMMTTAFKNATGGDQVDILQKYEKAYSTRLDAQFIISSNHSPSLTFSTAEERRAILVEVMSPGDNLTNGYEDQLWNERSAFITKCKDVFDKLFINGKIQCDSELFELESASFEDDNSAVFEENFRLSPDNYIAASQFQRVLAPIFNDNRKIGNFKEWLKRVHGINRKKITVNGTRTHVYFGITFRHSDNLQAITGGATWNS